MSGIRRLQFLLAGIACVALIGMVTLAGLVLADWREARSERSTLLSQLAYAVDRGDHLHYVVHLGLGRLADLCPCTRVLAEDQYVRALQHVRTERQEALVTSQRPQSPRALVGDAFEILDSGLRWADIATGWVASRVIRSPRF